ncbi:hypothetical protein AB205_0133370 [Aquarana catesbeiana]|uniref:PLA2c domain-containing protein n=1 Tax=Aquarana catesbeiana TaxID=8400 RepID=A0A2G9S0P8_AQUCT|nr:hypothetical protein AB205_0133370 [Aquarana catesbeiana]
MLDVKLLAENPTVCMLHRTIVVGLSTNKCWLACSQIFHQQICVVGHSERVYTSPSDKSPKYKHACLEARTSQKRTSYALYTRSDIDRTFRRQNPSDSIRRILGQTCLAYTRSHKVVGKSDRSERGDVKHRNESRLSDQQSALENGQNPLPIYLAMNVKPDAVSTLDFKEWCEFTPYEVGLLKYGASIRTEDFGSEFYMGRLMKKHPEPRICYLQGLWGNVFSLNLVDTWYLTTQLDTFWDNWVKDRVKDIGIFYGVIGLLNE